MKSGFSARFTAVLARAIPSVTAGAPALRMTIPRGMATTWKTAPTSATDMNRSAWTSTSPVPPSRTSIGRRNRNPAPARSTAAPTLPASTAEAEASAPARSLRPSRSEMAVAAPWPKSVPTAETRRKNGNEMVMPARAARPTPRPTKTRSTRL